MIILSGPWLSSHFIRTVVQNGWPLVDAGDAEELLKGSGARLSSPVPEANRILTSGEQALQWVETNLSGSDAARGARLFKDKAAFRRMTRDEFPELAFREIALADVDGYRPEPGLYPFVIKPAVGFFSIGVHTVRCEDDWRAVQGRIRDEIERGGRHFSGHMLSRQRLLIESYIEGDEFAVDAYFDDQGEPVVLNILEHRFASPRDVSDRLYVSSRAIVESVRPHAAEFLASVNRSCGLKQFPLHAEFRRTASGRLVPIEVNPLRLGGWCTTGDFAHFAWGFNSYELYMDGGEPDWDEAFRGREESEFALIVLENATGLDGGAIESFDYEGLLARFSKPLHLSRMDFSRFPLFGFLFAEVTPGHEAELDWILRNDLAEFVTPGNAQ